MGPDLSIVIVNWNTADLLCDLLSALLVSIQGTAVEIVVVDNGSTDGSVEMVRTQFPGVHLIDNQDNLGFARANNQGIIESKGRYVLLLNSDTCVAPSALSALVEFMDDRLDVGACSPRLVRRDGKAQPYAYGGDPTLLYLLSRAASQLLLRRPLHDWGVSSLVEVDWVSGACMIVRREAVAQTGLLDESMFMYFEDNDWCLRMRRAGWKVCYNPEIEIVHIGGQSLDKNPKARHAYYESLRYFYTKHYSPLSHVLLELLLRPYQWITRL